MIKANKTLVFGLLNNYGDSATAAQRKLRELTIAWSRYGYHGEIIEEASIDTLLAVASEQGYGFCLIQRAGHVIDEQWYLPHWQREGFHNGIKRLMTDENFLVAGQWNFNGSQWVGLKTDCLLVNLTQYQACAKPAFGAADGKLKAIADATIKAKQFLPSDAQGASDQVMDNSCDRSGWNFIQVSFEHQLPVIAFSADINNNRFDLLDSEKSDVFYQSFGKPVLNVEPSQDFSQAQREFFERIKAQIQFAPKGAFLLNIESYRDLKPAAKKPPLDALFSVAAGFKPYRILHSQGFHSGTQVVLFDYSQKALDIRQTLVNEWDGENFPAFVRELFQRFPSTDVFYQLWHNTTPETLDWNDMDVLWQAELEKWGGADKFKKAWQVYRKLPHQYVHCDLLKDQPKLLALISGYENTFIWWSNLFFTIYGHWHYSSAQRKTIYKNWINALADISPQCVINGADHNNVAINGITAAEYVARFDPAGDDELQPQHIHQVDLLF